MSNNANNNTVLQLQRNNNANNNSVLMLNKGGQLNNNNVLTLNQVKNNSNNVVLKLNSRKNNNNNNTVLRLSNGNAKLQNSVYNAVRSNISNDGELNIRAVKKYLEAKQNAKKDRDFGRGKFRRMATVLTPQNVPKNSMLQSCRLDKTVFQGQSAELLSKLTEQDKHLLANKSKCRMSWINNQPETTLLEKLQCDTEFSEYDDITLVLGGIIPNKKKNIFELLGLRQFSPIQQDLVKFYKEKKGKVSYEELKQKVRECRKHPDMLIYPHEQMKGICKVLYLFRFIRSVKQLQARGMLPESFKMYADYERTLAMVGGAKKKVVKKAPKKVVKKAPAKVVKKAPVKKVMKK